MKITAVMVITAQPYRMNHMVSMEKVNLMIQVVVGT